MVTPAPSDPCQEALWEGVRGLAGWDIGANTGESLVRMCRLFSHVVCMEPALESYAALRATASCITCCRVDLLPGAVAGHDGFLRMSEREVPIQSGQLTPDTAGHEPADGDWGSWGPPVGFRDIPCLTVDTLARQYGEPDFIKVDTEGHELLVLQGAAQQMHGPKPGWLIEFHSPALHDRCEEILTAAGYAVETVRHPHYAPDNPDYYNHGWLRAAREAPRD